MRRFIRTLLVLLGVVVLEQILETAFRVWAWRSRNPRALRLVKRYNRLLNPIAVRFSGRSGSSASVHHTGRRSGKPYTTPVIAHRSGDDIIISLPYGTDVDWLRNVLAAGRAVVDLGGRSYEIDRPEVVEVHDVLRLLPPAMVRVIRFNGASQAVRTRAAEVMAPRSA